MYDILVITQNRILGKVNPTLMTRVPHKCISHKAWPVGIAFVFMGSKLVNAAVNNYVGAKRYD